MRTVSIVSGFRHAGACKRLWICSGALGVFLLTILVGNHFISVEKSVTRQMLGHDFLAFYTAGSFVRDGRARDLYNLDAVRDFEQSTAHAAGLEVGKSFGPWWNPPFYALVFEPLAALPYSKALDLWRWISITALFISIGLLTTVVMRAAPAAHWGQGLLVTFLILTSMPFIQAISHGQNTFTSLLLLTVTVMLWRGEKKFLAGLIGGLLFYKPQLGAVVAAAMVLDLGWATLGGLSVTGIFLLITMLIAMPGSLGNWLNQLPQNVRWMQVEHAYLWERHVTLKAFWRLLLQGREAGEASLLTTGLTWISLITVGGALGLKMIGQWTASADMPFRRERLISATITAMPLLMPFYFDYDLLLLAVPAVLYVAERISHPQERPTQDRWFTINWVVLFLWLFFNPAFALHTHISGSVILLTALAATSIRRVGQEPRLVQSIPIVQPTLPRSLAA